MTLSLPPGRSGSRQDIAAQYASGFFAPNIGGVTVTCRRSPAHQGAQIASLVPIRSPTAGSQILAWCSDRSARTSRLRSEHRSQGSVTNVWYFPSERGWVRVERADMVGNCQRFRTRRRQRPVERPYSVVALEPCASKVPLKLTTVVRISIWVCKLRS